MKLLIYSDLQATDGSEVCYFNASTRLQEWRVERFFTALREIYEKYGCGGLIDLGDTTDDRSSIPVPTINSLIKNLDGFNDWNIKLIGNHEQFTKDASVNVGKLFEHKFAVVDKVKAFQCEDSDAILICAPFPGCYADLVKELDALTTRHRGERLILLGHFQVIGCQLNSGLAYEGVPKELLSRFDIGFLGHVHKPQEIVPNIYYVGSPFQQNFGESGESKRVGVFDTRSLTVEWVPLDGFPVYRTVTAKDFTEMVAEDSEDRYHVVLSSQADTELFFGHPLCNRATTEYSYTTEGGDEKTAPMPWSFESILTRWMEANPPKDAGIEISTEEMRDIGVQLAHGST